MTLSLSQARPIIAGTLAAGPVGQADRAVGVT
jgi:hypothetical protein